MYKIENSSILIFKKEVSKKASTVRMKGIVFDKKTRERLAGVTLVLNDTLSAHWGEHFATPGLYAPVSYVPVPYC